MNSVQAAIDTGEKYGMMCVMGGEDGWPGGFGAGKVNGMGEACWMKWLECREADPGESECREADPGEQAGARTLGFQDAGEGKLHISYGFSPCYVDNMEMC